MTPTTARGADAPIVPGSTEERPRYHFEAETPDTVGLGRRGVAVVLDFVLIIVLTWALVLGLYLVGYYPVLLVQGPTSADALLETFALLALFLELPVNLAYFTWFEGRAGATPGKRLLRLRVTKVDGTPLGPFDAFVRTLLRFLWITPGIGQLFMLVDAGLVRSTELDQRIGDLASDTVVVHAP